MKLKKLFGKILSAGLCLGMILGLMPSQALQAKAADEHKHCVCGATHKDVGDHTSETEITFTAWTKTDSLPDVKGNYYLTNDVVLTTAQNYEGSKYCGWKVPDGTVLCLNGHSITMQNPEGIDNKDVDVIAVTGHFTLTDCQNENQQGMITHGKDASDNKYLGKGVKVLGGTFDMYGGRLTGNTSSYDIGGSGVSIEGVSDTSKSSIYNLYGGKISDNTAKSGGGVHIRRLAWYGPAEFHMYGGSIQNNTADSTTPSYGAGGGVYVSWTSKFTMSGGTISGNTASQYGGGVYASALAKESAYVSGGVASFEVAGSAAVTGNQAGGKTENVYLGSSVSNYEAVSAQLAITSRLSGTIGVTTENQPMTSKPVTIATGATANVDYSNNIVSDDTQYKIRHDGNILAMTTADEAEHQHTWNSGEITKEPTTTAEGVKTFTCTVCGATKTEPIAKLVSNDYQIIDGANGKHTIGKDGTLTFRSDAPFSEFVAVLVDGVIVDPSNYDVSEGSTIVRLNQSFLDTLSKGSHTIAIQSIGGTAATNFSVTASSNSGNTSSGGTTGSGNTTGAGGTTGSATTPTPSTPTADITNVQPNGGTQAAPNTNNQAAQKTTVNAKAPATGEASPVSCMVLALIIVGGFALLIAELRRSRQVQKKR